MPVKTEYTKNPNLNRSRFLYKRCISFTNLASGIKKWRFVYRYAVFNLQTSFLPYKLASRITTQLSNEYRITLKGTLSHTVTLGADVFGNITRLNNALENLAGNLDEERAKLEEAKVQLENARTELDTPFAWIVSIIFRKFNFSRRCIIVSWLLTDRQPCTGVPNQTGDSC